MSTWLINDQSFASLGLVGPQLSRNSQAPSIFTFDHPGAAADSTPLFDVDSEVVIKRDSTVIFRGHITQVPRTGSGTDETLSYTAADAVDYLARWITQHEWPRDYLRAETWRTSHILANLTVTGGISALLTTRGELLRLLNWGLECATASGLTAPYQIGNILVGTTTQPPVQEYRDRTILEMIKDQLRWHRDAVMWLDYTTSPPTIHIERRANLTSRTINLLAAESDGYRAMSIGIRSREDLQLGSVVLNYEITETIDGQPLLYVTREAYPVASTGKELDCYMATFDMRGPSSAFERVTIATEPIDTTSLDWWLDHLPAHKARYNAGQLTDLAVSDVASSIVNGAHVNELLANGGQLAPWMEGITSEKARLDVKLSHTVRTSDGLVVLQIKEEWASVQLTATDAQSKEYRRQSEWESGELIPVGLAQQIYDANSTLHWEGALTLVETECTQRVSLGDKLNLTGGKSEWISMDALVQAVTEDFDLGQTQIRFGPPEQTGAQDLVELLRVNRVSVRYTAPQTFATGEGGDGIEFGDTSGLENSQTTAEVSSKYTVIASSTDADAGKLVLDGTERTLTLGVRTGTSPQIQGSLPNTGARWRIYEAGKGEVDINLAEALGKTLKIREIKGCDPATGQTKYRLVITSEDYDEPLTT